MEAHSMDLGLMLLRLLLAFVFFVHATQKLLGWFSGPGLEASASVFERLGQRPGRQMVLVAGASELASATLLGLGLMWPLAVVAGAGTMLVAGSSLTLKNKSTWNASGGGEYPFFIALVLICLAFVGPGSWSLDEVLDPAWHESARHAFPIGLGASLIAALAAVPPVLNSRRNLRQSPAPSQDGA